MMSCNPKNLVALEMFGDARKLTIHLKKEVYWEALFSCASQIVSTSGSSVGIVSLSFLRFWKDQRQKHHMLAFCELWKDMGIAKEETEQPQLALSARRLIYRYIVLFFMR